jgi:hypothetical protein
LRLRYNLKGSSPRDVGPTACLELRNLTARDAHILHWSGARKPITGEGLKNHYRGTALNDPIEMRARKQYMDLYRSWWARINETVGITSLGMTNKDER